MATVKTKGTAILAMKNLIWATATAQMDYDHKRDPMSRDLSLLRSLLPSFLSQIKQLALSLYMVEFAKETVPTSLPHQLSSLQNTMERTTASVISFALLPEQLELDTVDGHCGHLKQFRCSRLQDYLEDLRYSNLEFFDACWELLETAVPESNPKRSDKNPHTGNVVISDWKKEMMKRSHRSADLLDKMIWQCNQSDLGLLQPFWQAAVSEIDEALFLLHELIIHPTIRKPATLPTVRMVNMSIPIVKLTRLFFKKLSETATTDSMIRATSGINTWEFLIQVDITQTLARHVRDDLLLFLWRARGEESIEVVEAVNIRGAVEDIRYQFFNSLDRWRELVVPVPRQRDDRSPNQINFEDCFNLLEDQFVLATNKFFDLFTALDTVGSRELGF
ncbi:hypothetical protein MJO28_012753 [Puccinia striiformis f. sp. tritici]|uniref:Uncharacterized protein n=1 Tax=Puccinia striiformis f. sp. tritici TaxID=168172 RepID=A0ACC0E1C9_9BASI|nr:hypothetical protein MJO28_012753 [Puccinia striiformis f. sp. tritici]